MMRDQHSSPFQRMHGLWILLRLDAIEPRLLAARAADPDRGVRVHAMRVLSEMPQWTAPQRELALAGLRDADPYLQRAAAAAVGRHPEAAQIRPLLDLRARVPAADAQLLHVVRMALRDQLAVEGNLAQ